MIDPSPQPIASDWELDADSSRETIQLLMEEVARLEAELQSREGSQPGSSSTDPWNDSPSHVETDLILQGRLDELSKELASRDEMIALLLEQSQLYEEAAAAQKAEWEHLHHWVDEVERRVEGRDASDDRLRDEIETEKARSETLRRAVASDRRSWEAQRSALENEVENLRVQLSRPNSSSEPEQETAFIAMAAENRRLRAANAGLEKAASEVADLARRLEENRADLEKAAGELRRETDDRERERIEHKAELGALRSEMTQNSLEAAAESANPPIPQQIAASNPALDADERIRAFRQHLRELHDHEAEQRTKQSLSSRLSRIWRHTGPS